MTDEIRANPPIIDLAREEAFGLADLRVSPSTREVRRNGSIEVLEPRVMQVLVALAKADGAVVSREELYDVCWGGRIVGDDALQRCIARLRKFADYNGAPSFVIETIPRVGYRLVPQGGAMEEQLPPEAPTASGRPSRTSWKRSIITYGPWVAAGLVVAAVAAYLSIGTAEPRWRVDDVSLVVSDPGSQLWPALSPDGKTIAYAQWRSAWVAGSPDVHNRDIYLRIVGELESRLLTTGPGEKYAPQWSPDGRRIGYVVSTAGQPCTIMAVPVTGGTPQQLARCIAAKRTRFAWSKDRLVLSDAPSAGVPYRIVMLDLATGKRADLTHPMTDGPSDLEPVSSPDGSHIAFLRQADPASQSRLMLADIDGQHERLVVSTDMDHLGYNWAENSTALLYTLSRTHHGEVWAQPLAGERYLLHRGDVEFERLSEARGGRIAAEEITWTVNLATPVADENMPHNVIDRAPGETLRPSFRADGTAAFVSNRSGDLELWIKRPGLAASKLRSGHGTPFGQPIWSPDGSRIAVPVRDRGAARVAIVMDTGRPVTMIALQGARDINRPAWSDDGHSLIIPALDDRGGWRLWRADLASGAVVPFSSYGWRAISMRGGIVLQIQSGVAGIWRMDGGMRRIAPYPLPQAPGSMEIEGDRVLYLEADAGKATVRVVAQPLAGGAPLIVAELYSDEETGFTFDPYTRRIVYPATTVSQDPIDIALISLSRR